MAGRNQGRQRRKIGKHISARKRKRTRILLCFCLGCFSVLVMATYIGLYRYVKQFPSNQIHNNIYIDNVNVSGMTKKKANAAIEASFEKESEIPVFMKIKEESFEVALGELGVTYGNAKKAVEDAFDYGKEGKLFAQYWDLKKLEKDKKVFQKEHILDQKKTEAIIVERTDGILTHAVNATLVKEGDKFRTTKEKAGQTVNLKKAIKIITSRLNEKWNHNQFAVDLPLTVEEPTVVEKDLKSVRDKLGEYSTDAGGGIRWQNLKVAVEKLNGIIVAPGDELSVQDALAPFDAETGYVEAGSYENGQVVDSFGGGVCQATTTLYNAVLYAELDVVERHPHSMLVDYVDPSRDAAIATGVLEFIIKNNYDAPILITTEIDDLNQLHFVIYGKETRAKGRTVEYESETISTEDYGVTYKEDPSAPLGSMAYEGAPYTGVSAQLWKVVTQDGAEQSREVINHSTYQKVDQVIKIGTKSERYGAAAIVQQAIASQKDATIQSAIVKAKGLPQ